MNGPDPATPTAVDVLVDGRTQLGPLSYMTGTHRVRVGDAVTVPFSNSTRSGLVLGESTQPERATRTISEVHGSRVDPTEIEVARQVATEHCTPLQMIAKRLYPNAHKGADPFPKTNPKFTHQPVDSLGVITDRRRLLAVAPLISTTDVAVTEAERLSRTGQVLILCPTAKLVTETLNRIPAGAVRLDSKMEPGEWASFRNGTALIGVGTRSAALYSAANLAGVIVIDEDHIGHVERSQPYTHAADLAATRTRLTDTELVLITTAPTPRALGAGVKIHPVGTTDDWPTMTLIDSTQFPPDQRQVPSRLIATINAALNAGQPVTAVASSRPSAWRCLNCFEPADHPIQNPRPPQRCARCHKNRFRVVGFDTSRLESVVPDGTKIVTVDKLTRHPNQLVTIFDIDAAFTGTRTQTLRRLLNVITRAAASAGPDGRVLALTQRFNDPALQALFVDNDLIRFSKLMWEAAREADEPPFRREVRISVRSRTAPNFQHWPGDVHGPRLGADGWELLIRCSTQELPSVADHVNDLRRRNLKVRVRVS